MANKVIQLKNKAGTDNLFPIAGGTTQNTVTRGMLAEGVFEGTTLYEPSNVAYVTTANIQDGAVTTAKIANGAVTAAKMVIDTSMSTTSVNPVQNKIIKSALDGKMDKSAISGGDIQNTTSGSNWITSTPKSAISTSLPAGTYFITGTAIASSGGTANSVWGQVRAGNVTSPTAVGSQSLMTIGGNSMYGTLTSSLFITLTATTTVHMSLYTTAGTSDLMGHNYLNWIKIQ